MSLSIWRCGKGTAKVGLEPANPRRETGHRDATEARREQGLGIIEELVQCAGDRPLNQTASLRGTGTRHIDPVEQSLAERGVHVAQRDLGSLPCEHPPAACASRRGYQARLTQPGEGPSYDDRIRSHTRSEVLRRLRLWNLDEVS